MSETFSLFATEVYRAPLLKRGVQALNSQLAEECRRIAQDDSAGRAWAQENGYQGYTSYSSLADLTWRSPTFATLAEHLHPHAAQFARRLAFRLERPLELDSLWINILEPGGGHSGHIHPNAVLSGTYYVEVPAGAGGLKFEDPRLSQMMAAPPLKASAPQSRRRHVELAARPGLVLLWESFVRHEVPANRSGKERISISFNFS